MVKRRKEIIDETQTKNMKKLKISSEHIENTENSSEEETGNNNKIQLEFLVSYFKDLIANRNRDPTVLRRENLWQDVVENFSMFIRLLLSTTSDDDVIDFKLVGSALLCSTEFYVAELESLSDDVYKLSSTLQRSETKHQREGGPAVETSSIVKHVVSVPVRKKSIQNPRHIIKRIRTVVEPKLLNGKLETIPLMSPIFQKINSKIGDMCKADQFIRNNLPPSHTNLHVDKKFWSTSDETFAKDLRRYPSFKVALPIKMFKNFSNLRIRREIDYSILLSNRRDSVATDVEVFGHTDKLSADSSSQSDDDAVDDEEVEVKGSEYDVDENLNNILNGDDDTEEHGNINEIANLVETRHHDVDEDEEEKINSNNLQSAHEKLQLLSSSLIDLCTTGKHLKWRGEDKQHRTNRKIFLRDIEAKMQNIERELIILENSWISDEAINQRNWKKESLKLEQRRLHKTSWENFFDTFLYSNCEFGLFSEDNVRESVERDCNGGEHSEIFTDSGIVGDVSSSIFATSMKGDKANCGQLSEHSTCYDIGCPSPSSSSDFDDWSHSKSIVTSTPLQPVRQSIKRIENETLKMVNQKEGKPVKFSQLYSDVSRSLKGETSCALTFFSLLRAASSGEGDSVKVTLKSEENSVHDFDIQSVHSRSKRKVLFDSNSDSGYLSFKKQKLCENENSIK